MWPKDIKSSLLTTIMLGFVGFFAACGSSFNTPNQEPPPQDPGGEHPEQLVFENRSIDGSGNNLDHPEWGATHTALLRLAPPAYGDGASSMARAGGPSPRLISNEVCDQAGSMPDVRSLSAFVFQWGQFLDHDIVKTPTSEIEAAPISVPLGDPFFDPGATGLEIIPFFRSLFMEGSGTDPSHPREQFNEITSFIDASNIYGSDAELAAALRTFSGGKLKTSAQNLLPFEDQVFPEMAESSMFVSGDMRVNEQVALISMHTLFMREHNRLCEELASEHPDWEDEEIYQRARKIVGAEMQIITFKEFLPALLGEGVLGPYQGYDPNLNPSIFNSFATTFYRVGHSMLPSQLLRLEESGASIPEGPLFLSEAFFTPELIIQEGGIDPLLRGLVAQSNQAVDAKVVDGVRNFLFGPPGAGGLDLAALNIQRGRDHGLPDYNTLRQALGLSSLVSFNQLSSDLATVSALASLYASVDTMDPWVGALAADLLPGSSVSESIRASLILQFENLRHGDRFWYLNDNAFTEEDIAELEATKLSDIIRRNTNIQNIPDNVFFVN